MHPGGAPHRQPPAGEVPLKAYWGGRAGTKPWSFATQLLVIGMDRPIRVVCCREIQNATEEFDRYVSPLLESRSGQVQVKRYYLGADWGFSIDPTVLIRCFIDGRKLFIDPSDGGRAPRVAPKSKDSIMTDGASLSEGRSFMRASSRVIRRFNACSSGVVLACSGACRTTSPRPLCRRCPVR
jgi:hypothetical protein